MAKNVTRWNIPDVKWDIVGTQIGLEPEDKVIFEYLVGHLALNITKLTRLAILHYLHCDHHDPAIMELITRAKGIYRAEQGSVVNL